jgi:predicted 3-demethylubiquinone-9 3-methyltransferase (glyoxalase superfamily)
MQKITPCLWFNGRVEEALEFYTAIFKNAKVKTVTHYGKNMPMPAGSIMTAVFDIEGQELMILNGGPDFVPNEAISFVVNTKGQEETDYYWNALTANGGQESMCGWLKDPYGISWQITPKEFTDLLSTGEPARMQKAMEAMMHMRKLDLKVLMEAYNS